MGHVFRYREGPEDRFTWLVTDRGILHHVEGITEQTWLNWFKKDGPKGPTLLRTTCGKDRMLDLPTFTVRRKGHRCKACRKVRPVEEIVLGWDGG